MSNKDVVRVPAIGLGTFQVTDASELTLALKTALDDGYRLIDTAAIYNNEQIIGDFLQTYPIKRSELFITTKIWNDVSTYEETLTAFENSLAKLKTNYVDLILIHWPKGKTRNAEVYRALETLLEENKVRAIGVSNFMINHIDDLLETATVIPMMNQVEMHPYLQQYPLQEYCSSKNIALTSYGPFAKGEVFNDEILNSIAIKHNVSIAQVVVKWAISRRIFMIPKSVTPERIKLNHEINNFNLDQEDLQKIRNLNKAKRFYPSPDNIDF